MKPKSEVKEAWDYEKILTHHPGRRGVPAAVRAAPARWAEPMSELLQHAFNGLVSGSFYALLALGLAVIFGMLGVVNFAHGAFYMLGAFGAYVLLDEAGVDFWLGAAGGAAGARPVRDGAGAAARSAG